MSKRIFIPAVRWLGTAALVLLLSACGGGGSDGNDAPAGSGIILNITDAPVQDEDIAEVWVRFTKVIIQPADGGERIVHQVEDAGDPADIKPYRDIELKSLVGGKTMLLGEIALDAGDYSWVRLVIDPEHTRVVEQSGGDYVVKCPSCSTSSEQSGLKLNREFTIETTGWINFIIDFDLRKSLKLSQPNTDRQYILRPTLRIIDTELASSFIHGIVTDQRSEKVNPDFPDACWVYVYEGDAAVIEPDDICIDDPDAGISCPPGDRPLLETQVQYDGESGNYFYETVLIYPGLYTVALVCEADDTDADEDLLFMSETGVQADAVPGGADQPLALVDVNVLTLDKSIDGDPETVSEGDSITYRMSLGNAGNVTLNDVNVTDPLSGLGALTCDSALPASLAVGATLDCTAGYTVPAAVASVSNTATATAFGAAAVQSSVTVDVTAP